jgi:competence protein ComEC
MNRSFWRKNPALLYALTLLIATSSALFWEGPWNWIWPLCMGAYLLFLRAFPEVLLLIGGIFYGDLFSVQVESAKIAYFSPTLLKPHQSPFAKGLIYQGKLTVDGVQTPCAIHLPLREDRPLANCDYILKGDLQKRGPYEYTFRPQDWTPVEKTWSLAEFRFQMKERFRTFLNENLKGARVSLFLGSLTTGDVEDRELRYELGKLGLQHILAISGFHFAILMTFCSFFLRRFLSHKWETLFLLAAINLYFLFVGSIPAVQRSYLVALFYLGGKLLGRPTSATNLLGAALLLEVLFDPLISKNIGFQLSFLSCFGILLLRPLFLPLALRIFPKHRELTPLSTHGYLISSFLREALVLTLSVNAALLPVILYHFHTFPLLSLFYNLFYPFLVSICLFLLFFSILAHFLHPLLGAPFFSLTDFFTAELLDLSAYPPLFLDYSIRLKYFPAWIIPLYLCFLFFVSVKIFSRSAPS